MRNQICKPKKCELRHSVFLKQTILEAKIHSLSFVDFGFNGE